MQYSFDWFTNNAHIWKKYFGKLKDKAVNVLELGSFEGLSANWIVDNILVHPRSHLTCVDNFSTIKEQRRSRNYQPSKTFEQFVKNTQENKHKITLIRGDTRDVLKSSKMLQAKFDIIYIDAGRSSKSVLEDAILSFPLLKEGGYIVFDDYTNSKRHDYACPKKGIDAFQDIYSDELKVLNTTWQVVAKKVKSRYKVRACKSEFYS